MYESGAYNDAMSPTHSNDESNDPSDKGRRPPLLFRGGFFRFLKRDGVSVRAECLNCKYGNVYSGHMWSSSNFIKHLSVSFQGKTEENIRYIFSKERIICVSRHQTK